MNTSTVTFWPQYDLQSKVKPVALDEHPQHFLPKPSIFGSAVRDLHKHCSYTAGDFIFQSASSSKIRLR